MHVESILKPCDEVDADVDVENVSKSFDAIEYNPFNVNTLYNGFLERFFHALPSARKLGVLRYCVIKIRIYRYNDALHFLPFVYFTVD